MRKSFVLILVVLVSLSAAAVVPPRDPSKWAEWQERQRQIVESDAHGNRLPAATQAVGSRAIIPRILVISVNFTDAQIISSQVDVDSMFNAYNWAKDGAKGSIRQYFYDQSMGQYNPQFDVVGPVTLSHGYAYYGDGEYVSRRAGYMVTEACALVDAEVDFTLYDSNNDGYIDLVYILYAGYGENDPPEFISVTSDLIWPAYWNVSSAGCGTNRRVFDGKTLNAFEYSNELDGLFSTTEISVVAGIGVACHEFGHALGLPDLYYTGKGSANHKLLGSWDIMCYGPYNDYMHSPPSYSAYERFYMGWLTPTLITDPANLQLEHIATSNQAYMIVAGDEHNMDGLHPNPNIFYLLENRQLAGWDIDVPGPGLLLTRINYQSSRWTGNTVNNDPNNLGVDLIEADGLTPSTSTADGYYGKAGDLFPEGATEYLGITDHAIEQITMDSGVVRFAYRGGDTTTVDPETPTALPAIEQGSSVHKCVRGRQVLICTPNGVYNLLGIKQED